MFKIRRKSWKNSNTMKNFPSIKLKKIEKIFKVHNKNIRNIQSPKQKNTKNFLSPKCKKSDFILLTFRSKILRTSSLEHNSIHFDAGCCNAFAFIVTETETNTKCPEFCGEGKSRLSKHIHAYNIHIVSF